MGASSSVIPWPIRLREVGCGVGTRVATDLRIVAHRNTNWLLGLGTAVSGLAVIGLAVSQRRRLLQRAANDELSPESGELELSEAESVATLRAADRYLEARGASSSPDVDEALIASEHAHGATHPVSEVFAQRLIDRADYSLDDDQAFPDVSLEEVEVPLDDSADLEIEVVSVGGEELTAQPTQTAPGIEDPEDRASAADGFGIQFLERATQGGAASHISSSPPLEREALSEIFQDAGALVSEGSTAAADSDEMERAVDAHLNGTSRARRRVRAH